MYCSSWLILHPFRAGVQQQLAVVLFLVWLLVPAEPARAQGTISTLAGSTFLSFNGVGGPAVNATLGTLSGVTVDSAGNIYAFDTENYVVVKISAAGVLTIVAGNGTAGFSGDGGPATKAAFGYPPAISSLAVDAAGNLFIPDAANNRIRKVSADGIISTIAGDGTPEFSGDGGPATRASLNRPHGVAVDASGNLFISDGQNGLIRMVTPGGTISTVAGLTAGSVAADSAGNLFVTALHSVQRTTSDGLISTVAGNGNSGFSGDGGPATAAAMDPAYVAVDPRGNLFIVDDKDNRIRKVGRDGIISTVAGDGTAGFSGDGGPATAARFNSIRGLATDSAGNLLIADGGNRRIRKITPAGVISTVAGTGFFYFGGDGGPATAAWLHLSYAQTAPTPAGGVAADHLGNIFIVDIMNARVRKVNASGVISTVAGTGVPGFSGDGGPATAASVSAYGVAVDSAGNLYIATGARVRRVARDGTISTVAGDGSEYYSGDGGPATLAGLSAAALAVDPAGNLFIADPGNYRVRKVTLDGTISTVAGYGWDPYSPLRDGVPATLSKVDAAGVAVDPKGNLLIAGGGRVRKVASDGIISTIAGWGGSVCSGDGGPATRAGVDAVGLAVDAAGSIFIADGSNNRVRRIAPDGTIWTVAGNGSPVFSGDSGPATRAGLSAGAVVVDNAGSLYIADYVNNRIRKVLNPIDSADVPCVLPTPVPYFSSRLQNGASFSNDIAAGSLASLYGGWLTGADYNGWEQASQLPLPTRLKDIEVRLNGIAAPLLYASWSQINLQIPWELVGQNPIYVDVTVKGINANTGETRYPIQYFTIKRAAAPGVFYAPIAGVRSVGMVQVANTTILAARPGVFPGSRPANRGEYITIWCTGLGDVTNRPASGAPASAEPLSVTLAAPTVTIGGQPALVTFSGLAPGFVGLYQINAQVPADAPVGDAVPLTVTQSGVQSNTVMIAVQ